VNEAGPEFGDKNLPGTKGKDVRISYWLNMDSK
jgi:hypothetical protein